jgi:hypothetical protein
MCSFCLFRMHDARCLAPAVQSTLRLGLCTFTTAVAARGGSLEDGPARASWAAVEEALLQASGSPHPLQRELLVAVWSFLLKHGTPSLVRPRV